MMNKLRHRLNAWIELIAQSEGNSESSKVDATKNGGE